MWAGEAFEDVGEFDARGGGVVKRLDEVEAEDTIARGFADGFSVSIGVSL